MEKREKKVRLHLFARPSFLTGLVRLVDPFGTLNEYNSEESGRKADYMALRSDWKAVGQDIQSAMNTYHSQIRNDR
jgi:hypothetical protein